MKTVKLTMLLFIFFTLNACDVRFHRGSVEGNGNVTKEERVITEKIERIKVSNGIEVELINGLGQMVHVVADENLIEYIETELVDGTLHIRATKNIKKAESKKVMVYYIELDAIHTSSGASVKDFSGVISDELNLKASSGSLIDIQVMIKELSAETSSGSSINLKGQVRNFYVKASSGSIVDAKDLQALYCTSKASSGSNVTLNIQRSLDAKASSGGSIKYSGEPEVVNQNKSSSGSIQKI